MYVFPLVTSLIILTILAIFVPTRREKKVFRALIGLCLCAFWWHASVAVLFLCEDPELADMVGNFAHIGVLYLPLAYRRFYLELIGAEESNRRYDRRYQLIYGIFLGLLFFTDTITKGVRHFPWGYFSKAGVLHPLFVIFVFYVVIRSLIDSLKMIKELRDGEKRKSIQFGVASCLVFTLGSADFLINYGLTSFYPIGFVSSLFFVILNAIGIVKYDLYQGVHLVRGLQELNHDLHENVESKSVRLQEKEDLIERISQQVYELRMRDDIISSFVSPAVRRELALGENPLEYQPKKLLLSIVFIDMRNFAEFAESHELEEIFSLINKYFDFVNRSFYANGGEVNKYMGDGVLGLFINPADCLKAIFSCLSELEIFNKLRREQSRHEIILGVGISFGEVLSGNFGSETKLERSVIGDVVNIASRLEQLTKDYGCQVIADHSFIKQVTNYPFARPIGIEYLKGKSKTVLLFEIFEHAQISEIKYKMASKWVLQEALLQHKEGRSAEALKTLNSFAYGQSRSDPVFKILRTLFEQSSDIKTDQKTA